MKIKHLFASLIIACASLITTNAFAQNIGDLSLRLEPGLAVPVFAPQNQLFNPGVSLGAKVGISLCPWFDLGPSVSAMWLSSNIPNTSAGEATFLGGYARIKRPHNNTSTGFWAMSPWVDSDLAYVRTGPLDRLGFDIGAGVAWSLTDNRSLWLGPFVRGANIFEPGLVGFNSNDDRTLIVGVSLEFDPVHHTQAVAPTPKCPVCVGQAPSPTILTTEYVETIQFAVNSWKLDNTATGQLNTVVADIKSAHSWDAIRVEGYASSEGPLENNLKLAENRAKAVKAFLVASGLSEEKVSATGFGVMNPVASNKTSAGRVANRRATFVVKFTVIKKEAK